MRTLQRLTERGRNYANKTAFLKDEMSEEEIELERHLRPVEGATIDVEAIETETSRLRAKYDPAADDMDAELAPVVHKNLNISRRQAADVGIWSYLSMYEFRKYVHHRWPYGRDRRKDKAMKEKFVGDPSDPQENAFVRLYWGAELTYDPEAAARDDDDDGYELTRKLFSNKTLTNGLLDRSLRRRKELVQTATRELHDKSGIARDATTNIRHAASTLPPGVQTTEDIEKMVKNVKSSLR